MVILFRFSGDKPTSAAPPFVFVAPVQQGMPTDVTSKQPGDQIDHAPLGVSDITFVSESQAQSNSTRQKKRTRRRKAPIYWGKKPASKRKPDVKRKLDSELDLITAEKECVENGEHAESDTEDFPGNSGGDRSAEWDEETEKEKVLDEANCDEEGDDTREDLQDEEDDLDITENGVSSVNGDVILLDSDILASELNNDDLNSESALHNESGHVSHSPERTLKNHVLFEKVPSLPNGITTEGCSEDVAEEVEHIGENNFQIAASLSKQIQPTSHHSRPLGAFHERECLGFKPRNSIPISHETPLTEATRSGCILRLLVLKTCTHFCLAHDL